MATQPQDLDIDSLTAGMQSLLESGEAVDKRLFNKGDAGRFTTSRMKGNQNRRKTSDQQIAIVHALHNMGHGSRRIRRILMSMYPEWTCVVNTITRIVEKVTAPHLYRQPQFWAEVAMLEERFRPMYAHSGFTADGKRYAAHAKQVRAAIKEHNGDAARASLSSAESRATYDLLARLG